MIRRMATLLPILLLFAAALIALPAQAAPRLTLDEIDYNFGIIPQHSRVSHTFWLRSTGDDTLRIFKVVPGCGCTKAPLEKSVLAPGDSTRLEIIFSSGRYKGTVTKRPTIQSNANPGSQRIVIRSTVVEDSEDTSPLVITPARVFLDEIDGSTFSLELKNVSGSPLDLTLIDVPEFITGIDVPEQVPAGGTVTATVEVISAELSPVLAKSLTIFANGDSGGRYSIPIAAKRLEKK